MEIEKVSNSKVRVRCENCGRLFYASRRYICQCGRDERPAYCLACREKIGNELLEFHCVDCGRKFCLTRKNFRHKRAEWSRAPVCPKCSERNRCKEYGGPAHVLKLHDPYPHLWVPGHSGENMALVVGFG